MSSPVERLEAWCDLPRPWPKSPYSRQDELIGACRNIIHDYRDALNPDKENPK